MANLWPLGSGRSLVKAGPGSRFQQETEPSGRLVVNRRQFLMSSACACLATATAKIDHALGARTAPPHRRGSIAAARRRPPRAAKIQANRVITALRAHRMNFRGQYRWCRSASTSSMTGRLGKLLDRQLEAQVAMLNNDLQAIGRPVQNHRCPGVRAARMVPPRIRYAGRGRDEDCARQGHRSTASTSIPASRAAACSAMPPSPGGSAETPQLDGVVLHHASSPKSPTPWVQPALAVRSRHDCRA